MLLQSIIILDFKQLNLREDVTLAAFADTRMESFDRKEALSHEDMWE